MIEKNYQENQEPWLLQYLPEIYREEGLEKDFLKRFLGIFEKILDDFEKTTAGLPGLFDPLTAPGEPIEPGEPDESGETGETCETCESDEPENFLPFLAQWVALDLYELLGDKNREFILRAVEFYKQKGTAAGMEDLVTFLTGKKCLVKEFTRNVFRTYCPESCQGRHPIQGDEVMSKTVDWGDVEVRANFGTFYDGLHYVYDGSDTGLYNREKIGLYIFLREQEKEFIIEKEQLHKIIRSFLPVFTRAEIIIEVENYETYSLDKATDTSKERLHGSLCETILAVCGTYLDTVNWLRFISNKGVSNDLNHRTKHEDIDVEKKILGEKDVYKRNVPRCINEKGCNGKGQGLDV